MSIFSFFSHSSEPCKLPFVTDMHCHLLPGVDDGSPDTSTSLELIEKMNGWGIDHIITTPHITASTFENEAEKLDSALDSLRQSVSASALPVSITRSSENRLDDFFLDQLNSGNITPLPGNNLLVEFSWYQEPFQLDTQLFDLKCKGYNIIIAHPERYAYLRSMADRYNEIHRQDNAFQINLLSLAGHYGKSEKAMALHLIDKGMVDYIGTDIHNRSHIESITAWLSTREASRVLKAVAPHLRNDSLTF